MTQTNHFTLLGTRIYAQITSRRSVAAFWGISYKSSLINKFKNEIQSCSIISVKLNITVKVNFISYSYSYLLLSSCCSYTEKVHSRFLFFLMITFYIFLVLTITAYYKERRTSQNSQLSFHQCVQCYYMHTPSSPRCRDFQASIPRQTLQPRKCGCGTGMAKEGKIPIHDNLFLAH